MTNHPLRLGTIVFDTADPNASAEFWTALLGWTVAPEDSSDDWTTIKGDGGTTIAFQLAPDHVPPTWPDPTVPQQAHLDLYTDDIPAALARAVQLGAVVIDDGRVERDTQFRVLRDPGGHPFCICFSPQP